MDEVDTPYALSLTLNTERIARAAIALAKGEST